MVLKIPMMVEMIVMMLMVVMTVVIVMVIIVPSVSKRYNWFRVETAATHHVQQYLRLIFSLVSLLS